MPVNWPATCFQTLDAGASDAYEAAMAVSIYNVVAPAISLLATLAISCSRPQAELAGAFPPPPGAGQPSPSAAPAANVASDFEVIAELEQGSGNIAIGPTGRIVVSMHQMYEPDVHLREVLADGTSRPYPTDAWARVPLAGSEVGTVAVLGVVIDQSETLWFVDNGSQPPRLIAWDMRQEALRRTYPIAPSAYTAGNTFLNDLAVDTQYNQAYLADILGARGGAIVVVDLESGVSRRVLEGSPSVQPEADQPIVMDGRELTLMNGEGVPQPARLGLNPITVDSSNTWVYYGAMHGTSVYRVPTSALADPKLSAAELQAKVERFGSKPVSDGISIDDAGNVYITDLMNHGIGVTRPDGSYTLLFSDKDLFQWPDSIAAGPDGMMVTNINRLHLAAPLNEGENAAKPPFPIVRFKPLSSVSVGR